MSRSSSGFFLLVLFLLPVPPLHSQQDIGILQAGTPVRRAIQSGHADRVRIQLEQDHVVRLIVEQRGIDLTVHVYSPEHQKLAEFDRVPHTEGNEAVHFVTLSSGAHTVEISSRADMRELTGQYEIRVVEIRRAVESELRPRRERELARSKAIDLLKSSPSLFPAIRSPEMRMLLQLQVASLLWPIDERAARKLLHETAAEAVSHIAARNSTEHADRRQVTIGGLRARVLDIAAQHDVELALRFLQRTRPMGDAGQADDEWEEQEGVLELMVAQQVAAKHPRQAYQLAESALMRGYPAGLDNVISGIKESDPAMAARLTVQIAGSLQQEVDLLARNGAADLAVRLLQVSRLSPTSPELLSRQQYATLFSKALEAGLSFSADSEGLHTPARYAASRLLDSLKSMTQEMRAFAPGRSAAIEEKLAQFQPQRYPRDPVANPYEGPVNTALERIADLPMPLRNSMYLSLVERLASSGDFRQARDVVMQRFRNLGWRRTAMNMVDRLEIHHLIAGGRIDEGLQGIRNLNHPSDRVDIVTQVMEDVVSQQKRETVVSFLEQARVIVTTSSRTADRNQIDALLKIALAYSQLDPHRGTEIIELFVDPFNDLAAAAAILDRFNGELTDDAELNLTGGSIAGLADQIIEVLAELAPGDFDRVKATADRIRPPEVRVGAYIAIAESAIRGRPHSFRSVSPAVH